MPKERTNIAKFLKALSEKNYSEANKYLRAVVDTKLVGAIRKTQQEN